ncbi:MAG: EVE domain-containing protein [Metallosphaera yellowstonensis]|jgi:predicted RNA-binding protein|uniref:Uncharacterized protein conserved in archaea n=1 Tax=Metallosphaera yellowstonensis MK1 TaxID=671065 RepID=H2C7Q8_9CREN|nr:EVE domain-containing protein [Metallosphaera yellowstonensis]EHP68184.1 uncharacterized protein conserved in archaea [Metallosphaera yellowstonensis MK1]
MTFWLVPIQEDMWDNIQYDGVYGYKSNLSKYIKQGDDLIFYVSKYYATRYGGKIVGIGKVVSEWYYDDTPLYPEEKVRNRALFPHRVKVEVWITGACDVKSLIGKVKFVEDVVQLPKYLRNAPANLGRPIPDFDAKIIEECLRQTMYD